MKAQKGVEVLLYSYFNLDVRWGLNPTPRRLYPRGTDLIPIVQEAWWFPGTV